MLALLGSALFLGALGAGPRADTVDVRTLANAPIVDGRAGDAEYGSPTHLLRTTSGDVHIWLGRYQGYLYVAAEMPDTSFYWGDDLVVSLDPHGRGGARPEAADRQWYLRRILDSSMVMVALEGSWMVPERDPPMLRATRHHRDWDVASTSSRTGWTVELRIREASLPFGTSAPRIAFRTYNDNPPGWWSWPDAPAGIPTRNVERRPELWLPLRLR